MTASLRGTYGRKHYSSIDKNLADKRDASEWSASATMNFFFNKKRTFRGYLGGNYDGRKKTSLATIDPQYSMTTGLSYSMMNRRLNFDLYGLNLFASRYKGETIRDTYRMKFNNKYDYSTLYFSVRYNFSKVKDHSSRNRRGTRDVERRF